MLTNLGLFDLSADQRRLRTLGYHIAEAGVFTMLLIVVASLLGLEVIRDFRQDDIPDAVDGLLVLTIAGPDKDEIRIETYGEGETADVVLYITMG